MYFNKHPSQDSYDWIKVVYLILQKSWFMPRQHRQKIHLYVVIQLMVLISFLMALLELHRPSLRAGHQANLAQYLPRIETKVPLRWPGSTGNAACLSTKGTESAAFYQPVVNPNPAPKGKIPPYYPPQKWQPIDPSNYGDRLTKDSRGQPVDQTLLVVLHETVGDAEGAINLFIQAHELDSQQTSYHTIVATDGSIIYLVPPDRRAYGAGNSEFVGDRGPESVQTNPLVAASVNNFAYHIALETPSDGWLNDFPDHSGYTDDQYRSLAWLVARTRVATSRITTHAAIDREGARSDPRSFDFRKFLSQLNAYPRPTPLNICPKTTVG
jgi:N-acetylmuramoyl-L-alanine amidase